MALSTFFLTADIKPFKLANHEERTIQAATGPLPDASPENKGIARCGMGAEAPSQAIQDKHSTGKSDTKGEIMSQCSKILAHMQEHGSITPLEAFSLYKSLACHSRIAELREKGYQIATEMVETPTGKVVGRYTLVSRQNAPQRVAAPEPTRDAALPLDPVLVNYGPGKNGVVCEFVVEGYAPGCHPSER